MKEPGVRRHAVWVALVLLSALAVSACGGSSPSATSSSGTTVSDAAASAPVVSRFLARVNGSCRRYNQRIATIALPLDPARLVGYLRRLHGDAAREIRTLESAHPPAQLAPAYSRFEGYLRQTISLDGSALSALAGHDRATLGRIETRSLALQRRASAFAAEMGLWSCAADVEPRRFVAANPRQQLIAGMDQICSPAVAADWNVGTAERVVGDQYKSGAISRKAARARLAAALDYSSRITRQAASQLGELQAPLTQEQYLRDMVSAMAKYGQVAFGASQAVATGQPIDLTEFQAAIDAPAHEVGLDALRLHAGECVQL